MFGYSDRLSHALAFTAKYRGPSTTRGADVGALVQPANVALILTRYGCDHVTIEAGILHHVLEECRPGQREGLEAKIGEKFGAAVLDTAKAAAAPKYDRFGDERPWQSCKREHLTQLGTASARAIDVCIAGEIHRCGSTIAALRRLGVEYLHTVSRAGSGQAIWWYCSLLELLDVRPDATRRDMVAELRSLSTTLMRHLRHQDEEDDL